MTTFLMKLASAGALVLMLSGCATGTTRNLDNYGSPLMEEDITQVFSGNFLLLDGGPSGTYFSTDGSINVILPDGSINTGNWTVAKNVQFCTVETSHWTEGGKTVSQEYPRNCFFVFSDGAGSYILDPLGSGPNVNLPGTSIVRGFPMRNEFNALRRDLGV
jgi:hypothetical protein